MAALGPAAKGDLRLVVTAVYLDDMGDRNVECEVDTTLSFEERHVFDVKFTGAATKTIWDSTESPVTAMAGCVAEIITANATLVETDSVGSESRTLTVGVPYLRAATDITKLEVTATAACRVKGVVYGA